jgi:hypothetical protein
MISAGVWSPVAPASMPSSFTLSAADIAPVVVPVAGGSRAGSRMPETICAASMSFRVARDPSPSVVRIEPGLPSSSRLRASGVIVCVAN